MRTLCASLLAALLFISAVESRAQSQPPVSSPTAPKKKPRKVWTNDDVSSLEGAASQAGRPAAQEQSSPSSADARNVQWYRNQLLSLRAQLDDLDRRIEKFQSAKPGGSEGVRSQLAVRRKREGVRGRIAFLEADARRHGIAPGDLR